MREELKKSGVKIKNETMHCRFSARQLTPPTRRIASSDRRHHGCAAFPTRKTPLHGQLRMQTSLSTAMRHACSARRLITERSMVRSRWTRTKSGCPNGVPRMFRPCKCVCNPRPLHTCADWSTTLTIFSTVSHSGSSTLRRSKNSCGTLIPPLPTTHSPTDQTSCNTNFRMRVTKDPQKTSYQQKINLTRIKNRKSLSCDVRRRYIG